MSYNNRKAFAVEVKRNLIHLLVFSDFWAFVLQNRVIHRALDTGLEVAVDVYQAQNVVVVIASGVHMAIQFDLAFGQRARLIAAKDGHTAEILDRGELLDEDLFLCHAAGPLRQGDCDDHRHHLWRHPYCERHGKQERVQQGTVEDDIYEQNEKHQQHDYASDHRSKIPDAAAELGFWRFLR